MPRVKQKGCPRQGRNGRMLSFWDTSILEEVPSGFTKGCGRGGSPSTFRSLWWMFQFPGQPEKAWTSQEAMQMDADDYLSIEPGDVTSVSQSMEVLKLTEKIDEKLGEKANLFKEAILNPERFLCDMGTDSRKRGL